MTTVVPLGGAGALPFGVDPDGHVSFLFQRTFEGKKAGTAIDFAGAVTPGEIDPMITASREFTEETAGLLTMSTPDLQQKWKIIEELDEKGVQQHPLILEETAKILKLLRAGDQIWEGKTDDHEYYVYYFPIDRNIDLDIINKAFLKNKKRREFFWIPAKVVQSGQGLPFPLHPRVTCIPTFYSIVASIVERYKK
jgi:hypothetical protein